MEGKVRFVSNFRKFNQILERVLFPTPRIKDLLESLVGFQCVSEIDLNKEYFHIELDLIVQDIRIIVFSLGKYSYNRLSMGIFCTLSMFQAETFSLMEELEFVRECLNGLLLISKSTYEDHL